MKWILRCSLNEDTSLFFTWFCLLSAPAALGNATGKQAGDDCTVVCPKDGQIITYLSAPNFGS
jgi:hypothetical protein